MTAKPIPDGYHSINAYLIVDDAAKAIDFYRQAFGARELYRLTMPNGGIGHAEIQIGDTRVMLGDESPQRNVKSPRTLGGSSVHLVMYLADADAAMKQALAAGAAETRPIQTQFYGDRSGTVTDPFGHVWTLAMHVEDVSSEEMQRRLDGLMKSA